MKWVLIIIGALVGLIAFSVVAVSVLDALGAEMPEENADALHSTASQGAFG